MNLANTLQVSNLNAGSKCRACDIPVKGYSADDTQKIRDIIHKIPNKFLSNVKMITNEDLYPKHGRFVADPKVVLFDDRVFKNKQKWGNGTNKMTHAEMTLVHEIGHSVFESLSGPQQTAWMKLSGWQEGPGDDQSPAYKEKRPGWPRIKFTETHSKDAQFVRHYSEKGHGEDFADCFSWYINGHQQDVPEAKRNFIAGLLK